MGSMHAWGRCWCQHARCMAGEKVLSAWCRQLPYQNRGGYRNNSSKVQMRSFSSFMRMDGSSDGQDKPQTTQIHRKPLGQCAQRLTTRTKVAWGYVHASNQGAKAITCRPQTLSYETEKGVA